MKSIEVNTPHITGRQNKGDTADSEAHFNTSYPANHPPKALNLKKCDTLKTLVLYPSFLQDSGSYCHFAFYQSVSIRVRILQAFLSQTCLSPVFSSFSAPPIISGAPFSPHHLTYVIAMEDLWLQIISSEPDMWPPQQDANEQPL